MEPDITKAIEQVLAASGLMAFVKSLVGLLITAVTMMLLREGTHWSRFFRNKANRAEQPDFAPGVLGVSHKLTDIDRHTKEVANSLGGISSVVDRFAHTIERVDERIDEDLRAMRTELEISLKSANDALARIERNLENRRRHGDA